MSLSNASSDRDVKSVLRDVLETTGAMRKVRASLRAHIFECMSSQNVGASSTNAGMAVPALSNENLIINELFREYLEYNHYFHTAGI